MLLCFYFTCKCYYALVNFNFLQYNQQMSVLLSAIVKPTNLVCLNTKSCSPRGEGSLAKVPRVGNPICVWGQVPVGINMGLFA